MVSALDLTNHIVSTTFHVSFLGCIRQIVQKHTGLVILITGCIFVCLDVFRVHKQVWTWITGGVYFI